jgi:hypothetical protein
LLLRIAVLTFCCALSVGVAAAAAELPDDRAYELVSPYDTGQGDIIQASGLPDGEHALMLSLGFFAGHPSGVMGIYRTERSPAGWQTRPVGPPDDRERSYQPIDATDDASRLFLQPIGGLIGGGAARFDQMDADGSLTTLVEFPDADTSWAGRSADGARSFVHSDEDLTDDYADPVRQLYEVTGGDVELVGRDEAGDPLPCGAELGSGATSGTGRSLGQNAISDDAGTIVYTTPAGFSPPCADPPAPTLYVARDGDATAISVPEAPEANAPATFVGMDPAGTRVFFMTAGKLTADDDNGVPDLYAYSVGSGDLERITADPSGDDDAAVDGAVVSADGSHVYFTTANALGGDGEDGSRNLFVWNEADGIDFVVTSPQIGSMAGTGFYQNGGIYPTPDGRHLLFWSQDRLTEHENTTEGGALVTQAFQYSADRDEIRCVTCHPDPAVHPVGGFGPRLAGPESPVLLGSRTQSDDGRFVIFVTPERLLPGDLNTKVDLYEWRSDGELFLISTGKGIEDVGAGGISADGRDIFFTTSERLVPGLDQDNVKLYDARIGGGLPAPQPPPSPPSCAGDECQGMPTPRPADVVPGSAGLIASGNESDADRALRLAKVSKRALRRAARTGRLRLSVTVAQPGRVTARAKARLPRKGRRTIATSSKTVKQAGRVQLTLKLSKAARKALTRRGLKATLRVTAPGATPQSRKLALPRR